MNLQPRALPTSADPILFPVTLPDAKANLVARHHLPLQYLQLLSSLPILLSQQCQNLVHSLYCLFMSLDFAFESFDILITATFSLHAARRSRGVFADVDCKVSVAELADEESAEADSSSIFAAWDAIVALLDSIIAVRFAICVSWDLIVARDLFPSTCKL